MQPFYRPSLKEVQAAISEVSRIRSTHGDVHGIHSIACCFVGYESLLKDGTWSQNLQRGFDRQLLRARYIDKMGVDTPAPFALAS
jgi:hypothetical protein